MPYKLPILSYSYDALEPYIDAKTMEVHHSKHHQGYTDKTNVALERTEWAQKPIEDVIENLSQLPEDKRMAVRNNGGGYLNHNIFFRGLAPAAGGEPQGALQEAINQTFGSFQAFREKFTEAALSQFGSGWAWLVLAKGLEVVKTPNQDSPLTEGKIPLLCIDVWEHAYYLKYQNRRPEYVEAFWNVVNWEEVARRFQEAAE